MKAIYVPISADDLEALRRLSLQDRRRPQDQAAVILTNALRRRIGQPSRRQRAEPAR